MPGQSFALHVNGRRRVVSVADAEMPLLWVLRDRLGLTGTKFGCGMGICGACTVHLDGRAARSCQVPIREAARHRVVTIEGLSAAGDHPCQRAWIAEDVAKCGYCQAGMIMTAAALLTERPKPSDGEIDAALSENVCRCGTYRRIRRAVARASGRTA